MVALPTPHTTRELLHTFPNLKFCINRRHCINRRQVGSFVSLLLEDLIVLFLISLLLSVLSCIALFYIARQQRIE
jgi:hypothetical protein